MARASATATVGRPWPCRSGGRTMRSTSVGGQAERWRMGDAQRAECGERLSWARADELYDVVRVLVVEMLLDGPVQRAGRGTLGFASTTPCSVRSYHDPDPSPSVRPCSASVCLYCPAEAGGPEIRHLIAAVIIGVPIDVPDASYQRGSRHQTDSQRAAARPDGGPHAAYRSDRAMRVRPSPPIIEGLVGCTAVAQ